MLDPAELYRIRDDVAGAAAPATDGPFPVLVHQLQGYIDAGHAGRLAVEHLLATLSASVVATFDVDQLLDYRSRRPNMTFQRDHWADYDEPMLALHAVRDLSGTQFLLLTGPEPDTQWERFTAAVMELVERFGVELTIGLNAIPMAVPHTRPAGITAHATRRELIADYEQWSTTAELPGSAAALLELRLGQADRDAMGLAAHVPHYLSETDYPQAARTLLEHLAARTRLALPTDELTRAAEHISAEIERKVADSERAVSVVRALERRYDSAVHAQGRPSLLADDQQVPSGDEIGAEIEQFLAEQA
ncbi:MAG: PAC2 family protein [Actinomycetota bacterium]|nr:PAC2 family protein [Actinomycetota bacterium]